MSDLDGDLLEIDLDLVSDGLDLDQLEINDPAPERARAASLVARWGIVAATLDGRVEVLIADRNHLRAAAISALLAKDEKLAEWKVNALVDSQPQIIEQDRAIARARTRAKKVRVFAGAYVRKSDMLRAMIASEAGPARAANDIGRTPGTPDPRLEAYRSERKLGRPDHDK